MKFESGLADAPYDHLRRILSSDFGVALPALTWRADLMRNEITFLDERTVPGLEDQIPRLLQDSAGAAGVVAADDLALFGRFHEDMRQRLPVSEVFRVRGGDGVMRWLLILGAPDPEFTASYVGLVADCTGLANGILKRGSETGLSEHVELFPNPVLMVDVASRRIIVANSAARDAFGTEPEKRICDLTDLLAGNSEAYLRDIYERLLFSLCWNGVLSLRLASGEFTPYMTRVRTYDRDGHRLLWLSMTLRQTPREIEVVRPAPVAAVVARRLGRARSVRGLLDALLEGQPASRIADAVMLSRIFISRGIVRVTAVGKPLEAMGDDTTYPYAGSIAENIVLFDLESVLVEDTSKSIKPIDWALFIPHGIRSYFAVPFFQDGVLGHVVIFGSTRAHAFSSGNTAPYAALAASLWEELPRLLVEDPGGSDQTVGQ